LLRQQKEQGQRESRWFSFCVCLNEVKEKRKPSVFWCAL
jgi:hypothetical protein